MNQVSIRKEPSQKLMLLDYMADKYSLKADEFSKTVRATCGLATATAEQFAAFLIVAKEYDLNPLTKEIYAFPAKGGGIVPIVSIDGWVNLVNSNPQCDGFEFEMEHAPDGELISCTCTMYRKDRSHPVCVTEYYEECKRATEPWKMKHRMLRHKSMIQAARYAFGFAGIYDEDEGRIIAEATDITPPRQRVPSPTEAIEHKPSEPKKEDPISTGNPIENRIYRTKDPIPSIDNCAEWMTWALGKIAETDADDEMDALFESFDAFWSDLMPLDRDALLSARKTRETELEP
jgi:phage recombination protein Bet